MNSVGQRVVVAVLSILPGFGILVADAAEYSGTATSGTSSSPAGHGAPKANDGLPR